MFKRILVTPGFGTLRACADDIASAVSKLRHLISIASVFQVFAKISGLVLHATKCVLILTSIRASPENVDVIRQWLSVNIPEWKDMHISNSGLYLGMQVGPQAGAVQWKAALDKYKTRVDLISKSGLTAALACLR